jgi:membrane protease YdiL (CAAX protease family)
MSDSSNYGGRGGAGSMPLLGGYLGVAGAFVGMAIFVAGCFGFGAAFTLSPIPLILGSIGFILAFVGGLFARRIAADDPQVVASLIINVAVIAGGLLEAMIWRGVPIFSH